MPDLWKNTLRDAVEAILPQGRPDFQRAYARVPSRFGLWWVGLSLGVAAAAVLVVLAWPQQPASSFDRQVDLFVNYVYQD